MPTALPVGFADAFATDATKRLQWNAFLKKNRLVPMELANVVVRLRDDFHKIGII